MKRTGLTAAMISGAALWLGGCETPEPDGADVDETPPPSAVAQEEAQFDSAGIQFQDARCNVGPLGPPATIDARNGQIELDKQPVLVCRGDQMTWGSGPNVASWEVNWKRGNSPLDPGGPVRSGANGQGGGRAVALGAFEYDIRVVTTAGDTLFRDPDVVILPGTWRLVSQ